MGARRGVTRVLLATLLALFAFFAPAAASTSEAIPTGESAGCSSSSHEELRSARPERERPRPALPRPERPVVEQPRWDVTPVLACDDAAPASTPAETLPLPLDRLPVDRN